MKPEQKITLPDHIQRLAFWSGTELAWLKEDLPAVFDAMQDRQFAILGGEVWVVNGETINAGPLGKSGTPTIYHWSTQSLRTKHEAWAQLVGRAINEAREAIEGLGAENDICLKTGDRIYYNITFVSETEWL